MKNLRLLLLPLALLALSPSAWSDHDEDGRGRRGREYEEEYWDGNCKVERKFKKNGEYKEKRKCKQGPPAYYVPAPVQVVPAPAIPIQPGVTIQGTVRL